MLPYLPKARPSPKNRKDYSADADGASLAKTSSKSSKASSGGEAASRASQDAPLEEPDRPAEAAGSSVGPEQQHHRTTKHGRRTKKRNQHLDELEEDANHEHASAGAPGGTGATPPHHTEHHHQKPPPSASATSPPLPSGSSPKPAQQSAFKRASHNLISRGKHHYHHDQASSSSSLAPDSKHAQAHGHRNPSSSPRSPTAAQMNGSLSVPVPLIPHEFFVLSGAAAGAASRNMSSTTDASSSSRENLLTSKPFVLRNGRSYLNDTSLAYPLPADLTELHRQSMRTLLLIQVFGSPVCSPIFSKRPPQRVLEIGCGSGFWSMMCHRYFKSRGHGNISFTGIDIAPLAPTGPTISTSSGAAAHGSHAKPDPDMRWNFISHDLRQLPWPMESQQFDLVMVKDMSLATTNLQHQPFVDEYIRLLRPGGVLEIWESDHLIRMLRPHVPESKLSGDDTEDQEAATNLGAYVMNANTPLSAPLNTFLIEYNQWLSRALEARDLTAVPCTLIGPTLLQESEALTDVRSRRMAIPLSEVRWEREGVGGIVTKDGKITAASKEKTSTPKVESRVLSPSQEALRQTALLTVVQQVQALEPILREVSGKSQDEWDVWMGKMMGDLMSDSGTSWGECLEVGAWSATKRKR